MGATRLMQWYGFLYGCVATVVSTVLCVLAILGFSLIPDSRGLVGVVFSAQVVPWFLMIHLRADKAILRPVRPVIIIGRCLTAFAWLQLIVLALWLANMDRPSDEVGGWIVSMSLASLLLGSSLFIMFGWGFGYEEFVGKRLIRFMRFSRY